MKLLGLPLAAAMLVSLLAGCAAGQKRQAQAMARMESAADEFRLAKRRYPRSVAELQAFLAIRNPPEALDLEPFAEVTILPSKDGSFTGFYKSKGAPSEELGVLVTSGSPIVTHCGTLGQVKHQSDK